jgi:hypothetical protein
MKQIAAYKKSMLTGIGFLFFIVTVNAQDGTAIKNMLQQKNYAHAKEAVDKLVVEKETEENYFLKAVVYDSIAKSQFADGLLADARWQAFLALQKAALVYKQYVYEKGKYLCDDLTLGFINEGLANFNAAADRNNKAGFETAWTFFKKASAINEFGYALKWDSAAVNPLLLLLLAKSSIYAEKESDALVYCKKIIDNNPAGKPLVTGNEIIYQWLLYYYSNRKDEENFDKYLPLAKAAYPANQYFFLAEMDWLRQQQYYTRLFKKYQDLIKAEPGNLQYRLAFSTDIFNSLWPVKNAGATIKATELVIILKPLIANKQTDIKASLLLAKTYINMAQDVLVKKERQNYLQLSNKYLRQIINAKENANKPERKEAKQLMVTNAKALKPEKGK